METLVCLPRSSDRWDKVTMDDAEAKELLIRMAANLDYVKAGMTRMETKVEEAQKELIAFKMSLAQGQDRFNAIEKKVDALKEDVEKNYIRKDILRAYVIGAATASGLAGAGLMKLLG